MLDGRTKAFKDKKAITLLEIILASSLIGIIIVGILNLYLTTQRIVGQAREQTQIQTDAAYISAHISQNFLGAFDYNLIDENTLRIKRLSVYTNDPRPIPSEFKDDSNYIWSEYKFDPDTNEVFFTEDINNPGESIKLAHQAEYLRFTDQNAFISVTVKIRNQEQKKEIELETGAMTRCMAKR